MAYRDRIKELRRVRAGDLQPNSKNYRLHGDYQKAVLSEAMERVVGVVDAVIARETASGSLELVDGHLRADLDPEAILPVLVVDLAEDEVDLVIATLDPIAGLAAHDGKILNELLDHISGDSAEMRRFLTELRPQDVAAEEEEPENNKDLEHDVPGMELGPNEHYDYLVVLARTTREWNVLCDALGVKQLERRGKTGIGRGVPAADLIHALGLDVKTNL